MLKADGRPPQRERPPLGCHGLGARGVLRHRRIAQIDYLQSEDRAQRRFLRSHVGGEYGEQAGVFSAGVIAVRGLALAGRSVLVVEDEPLIAIEIRDSLRSAGATVFVSHCPKEALQLADYPALSAAVLDFGLRDDEAGAVCERLNARDIPFVLYTGSSDGHEACRKGLPLAKPASRRADWCGRQPSPRRAFWLWEQLWYPPLRVASWIKAAVLHRRF